HDEVARLQPVDEPRDGDRLDLDDRCQLVLSEAGLTLEVREDHPLGTGHAARPRALVRARAHGARDVVKQKQEVLIESGLHRYSAVGENLNGVNITRVTIERQPPVPGAPRMVKAWVALCSPGMDTALAVFNSRAAERTTGATHGGIRGAELG